MANYYYEISDAVQSDWDGKYHMAHARGVQDAMTAGGFAVTLQSKRIWRQDNDGSVKFVKHREEDPKTAQVDLKEFMWVKLKAKTLA